MAVRSVVVPKHRLGEKRTWMHPATAAQAFRYVVRGVPPSMPPRMVGVGTGLTSAVVASSSDWTGLLNMGGTEGGGARAAGAAARRASSDATANQRGRKGAQGTTSKTVPWL